VSLLVRLADAEVLDLELRVEERLGVSDGGARDTDQVLAGSPWRSTVCVSTWSPQQQQLQVADAAEGAGAHRTCGGDGSLAPWRPRLYQIEPRGLHHLEHPRARTSRHAALRDSRSRARSTPAAAATRCRCRAAPHPPHARSCSPHRHPWCTQKRTGV
jgi:hypothetical protein